MKQAKMRRTEQPKQGLKFQIEGKTVYLELPKTMTIQQLAEIIMNKKQRLKNGR